MEKYRLSLHCRVIFFLSFTIFFVFIITIKSGTTNKNTNALDIHNSISYAGSLEKQTPDYSSGNTKNTEIEVDIETTTFDAKLFPDMFVKKKNFKEHVAGDKVIYLTFDDGPSASTIKLLDILDELDVRATFFVTAQFGDNEQLISIIKEIHDRGHALGVHLFTHDYNKIYSTVDDFLEDYKKMDDLIISATGERSKIFRFPGGSNTSKNELIRADLIAEMEKRGFIFHDWNARTGDTEGYGKEQQIECAVGECSIKEKSVLLMHNLPTNDTLLEILPIIVNQLKERGYRFDVLDETVRPFQFSPSSQK